MPNANVTFGRLRHWLVDLGFADTATPQAHIFFAHAGSGAELALPAYRDNQVVRPHHLMAVRRMLDGFGLLPEREFDAWIATAAAERSAS